ncbi:MAG: hypothetical protein C0599_05600 [Salinivirgaceae bacterium]|mgnify:CR=1 FL=1|nr:MAG: hypothetical protein C0599_05600 [Salinivirgaceae bacterium]
MHVVIVIVIFVLVFAGLRFLVVLSNVFLFRNLASGEDRGDKSVAVLIPARNEEDNIGNILHDLSQQTIAGFEVLVYDDLSDDNTVKVINDNKIENTKVQLINGEELPKGWGGKNHACYQLAQHTNADILVFLDADVRIKADFLHKITYHLTINKLDLLSIFPIQITSTIGEKIVVPLFNWILLTLLPLRLVWKSSWSSFSAANGQCMVFNGETYRKNQWHKLIRAEVVEDISIMKEMKKRNCNVETLIGQKEISCRMYHTFKESFNGLARSAPAFFANNILWAISFLGLVLIAPISLAYINVWYLVWFGLFVILVRIIVAILGKANILYMILLHIPQMVVLLFIVLKGFNMRLKNRYQWKNREINF